MRCLIVFAVFCGTFSVAPGASLASVWKAQPTWYWQLDGALNMGQPVDVYDIDGFDNTAATVANLHRKGRHVICYVSAGTYEDWRPDAKSFPDAVKGNGVDGWPGENWLDVSKWDVLRPIIAKRVKMCANKGFDAVEFDNVDGYQNETGFSLDASDQLGYNRKLAKTAHSAGLLAVLKNDVDQVSELQPSFDIALNEECARYNECGVYKAFLAERKPVLQAEYGVLKIGECSAAKAAGRMAAYYNQALDGRRFQPCWGLGL